jgi:hypothetical protein
MIPEDLPNDKRGMCTLRDGSMIQLIKPDYFSTLPNGTVLDCINGKEYTKGVDDIDDDTRGGYLAFGFKVTYFTGESDEF